MKKQVLPCLLRTFLLTISCLAMALSPVNAQGSLTLTINNVDVTAIPEKVAYEVGAHFSVLDADGSPVRGLDASNFAVIEDAQSIKIESVAVANDPINLALALDTSGSMYGSAFESAKQAANNFLLGLGNEDQVSLLSFNDKITTEVEFTKDRQAAGQKLAALEGNPNGGTCLYDAAYQAVQSIAALPTGRRAVVLFTDGVDRGVQAEQPCSKYTIDDLIKLATDNASKTPIYIIGLGSSVDQQSLQRLAGLTGGRFQFAPTADQLNSIFKNLSDQLKSQYVLKYSSKSGQGSHSLVIQVTTPNGTAKDTRNFLSPVMPGAIGFKDPTEGREVTGNQKIAVTVTGQQDTIAKVVFSVGGKEIGTVEKPPYQIEFEFTSTFSGSTTISAVALDAAGKQIIRKEIQVLVVIPTEVPTLTAQSPAQILTATVVTSGLAVVQGADLTLYLIVGGVGLLILVVAIYILSKRKKKPAAYPVADMRGGETIDGMDFSKVMAEGDMMGNLTGTLTVTNSDDPTLNNHTYEIRKKVTSIGKLADNDIPFPNDTPVSRHHAVLEKRGERLFLRDVMVKDERGILRGPRYGTFVNDARIENDSVELKNNDEIRLGNRLKLVYHTLFPTPDATSDQITNTLDQTNDSYNTNDALNLKS